MKLGKPQVTSSVNRVQWIFIVLSFNYVDIVTTEVLHNFHWKLNL